MFEAKLSQAAVLKKLLDAAKDLVTDANFECNEEGLNMQAMDNSHVALVAIKLDRDGFKNYRCDHSMPLGVNLTSLTKVLKCSKDDDIVTLRAEENADVLFLKFEAKNTDRVAEYEMKLMDIDQEQLGIPDTDYDCKVYMPTGEFSRICRELSSLGESVRIDVTKEGVRFASEGDIANGSVHIKPTEGSNRYNKSTGASSSAAKVKKEKTDDDEEMEEDDGGAIQEEEANDEDEDEQPVPKKKKKAAVVDDEDEDAEPASEPEEEDSSSKKRKRKADDEGKKKAKKGKKAAGSDDEDEDANSVHISVTQAVSLSFSLKYLINFAKAAGLTSHVELMMSADVPLLCAFTFQQGSISYYLAPKIGDE